MQHRKRKKNQKAKGQGSGTDLIAEAKKAKRPLRLNVGAGDVKLEGYVPIDRKLGTEAYPLDVPDGSVDEIRASHILEHFSYLKTHDVLCHWISKLRPGGILKVAVPDFREAIKPYLAGKRSQAIQYVMGGHVDENDYHLAIFDLETLTAHLKAAGLVNIRQWRSQVNDCAVNPVSLNLMGNKPRQRFKVPNTIGVLSLPRFDFTDNRSACDKALRPLGIYCELVQGVYWEQVVDRAMSRHLHDALEFVLVLDGDSYFVEDHVLKLFELAASCPEADAIVPLQVKREKGSPLFTTESGEVSAAELELDLVPIKTGHFGLTLIRTRALRNLKRPWFKGVPAADGTWDDGRTDPDIYFWRNFIECGLRPYLAPAVKIAHLQLVASWPGEAEDGLKPVHQSTSELDKTGVPEHCKPKLNNC